MKIRIVQKDINNADYNRFFDDARSADIDLVALGELAATGCLYNGGEGITRDEFLRTLDGYPFAIMIGYPERDGDTLRNTYLYYDGESIEGYYKINLFPPMNEPAVYTAGQSPGLFETPWGMIGASICYDVRFPDVYSSLKTHGAKLLIVPAAFPRVRIEAYKSLLVERAKETGLPIIGINAVGDDGTNEFGGSSSYISPTGEILWQADETSELVHDIEIDL